MLFEVLFSRLRLQSYNFPLRPLYGALCRSTTATIKVLITGFPPALEIMENLENHEQKFHAWKKSWNLKKT